MGWLRLFDVPRGEVFGFLGPNGAGKSTTINVLCTLAQNLRMPRVVRAVWRRDMIRFLGNRAQTMTWLVQPLTVFLSGALLIYTVDAMRNLVFAPPGRLRSGPPHARPRRRVVRLARARLARGAVRARPRGRVARRCGPAVQPHRVTRPNPVPPGRAAMDFAGRQD